MDILLKPKERKQRKRIVKRKRNRTMSKAEQRALEAYPPKYVEQERHSKRVQSEMVDTHQPMRAIYIKGYHQAEKDLALTIEDIEKIDNLLWELSSKWSDKNDNAGYFQEVLNRFNKLKGK